MVTDSKGVGSVRIWKKQKEIYSYLLEMQRLRNLKWKNQSISKIRGR